MKKVAVQIPPTTALLILGINLFSKALHSLGLPKLSIPYFGNVVPPSTGVNFQFSYENNITDTIYQENDPTLAPYIYLEVLNGSPERIKLATGSSEVGEGNYHFALKFPKGVMLDLAQSEVFEISGWSWDVGYDPDTQDNHEVLYFLKNTEYTLAPFETIKLSLLKFCASPVYNNLDTAIYLLYGPLIQDSSGGSLEENGPESKDIKIIDPTGKTNIPLYVGFVGSNKILNDGEASNELTLRITNTNSPNSFKPNLSLTSESELIVSFETGEEYNKPYALAEVEKVKNISISVTDASTWEVQHTVNSTEWTITPQGDTQELAPGNYIELKLTSIVTRHPTGNANLYLRYQGVPNYQDGQFDVPIEKTPLLFRNKQVCIGTDSPDAMLHINGTIKLDNGDISLNSGKLYLSSQNQLINFTSNNYTGIGVQSYTQYFRTDRHFAWYQDGSHSSSELDPGGTGTVQMVINDGDVGIGIKQPQAKLHVDGNVNIGTIIREADLHVSGRIKDKTGYVMPVGAILPYAGSVAPEGWLLCDGDYVDKDKYADLYEVVGTTYGSSSDDFQLPDLRGRVPVGVDGSNDFKKLGIIGGEKTHKLTVNEMPSHDHDFEDGGHNHSIGLYKSGDNTKVCGGNTNARNQNASTSPNDANITFNSSGGGQPHNNLQPYLTINYIIKT